MARKSGFHMRIDMRGLRALEQDLRKTREKAMPFAIAGTVNDAAFLTQRFAKSRTIDRAMIVRVRNRHGVKGGLRITKAKAHRSARRIEARFGSLDTSMRRQELGGVEAGHSIPTGSTAGQGRRSTPPRRKIVRKESRLERIHIPGGKASPRDPSPGRVAFIKVLVAQRAGQKFIHLRRPGPAGRRGTGVYRVFRSKDKALVLLHRFKKAPIRTPRNPWLVPAKNLALKQYSKLYIKNLNKQIARWKLYSLNPRYRRSLTR